VTWARLSAKGGEPKMRPHSIGAPAACWDAAEAGVMLAARRKSARRPWGPTFIRLFSLQRVFALPCAPHPLLDIVGNRGPAPHARKTAPELRIGSGLMLDTVDEHVRSRSEQIF
jgi:hypothetical protein